MLLDRSTAIDQIAQEDAAGLGHVALLSQREARHVFDIASRVAGSAEEVGDDGVELGLRIDFAECAAGRVE